VLPVEILASQETIVLRARGSELLILPHHVHRLKALVKPTEFSAYFRAEALVNRPARKLFEAWLRKDTTVWTRLYRTVHHEMELASEADTLAPSDATSGAKVGTKAQVPANTKPAKDTPAPLAATAVNKKTPETAIAPTAPAKATKSKDINVAAAPAKAKNAAASESVAKAKEPAAKAKEPAAKAKEPAAKAKEPAAKAKEPAAKAKEPATKAKEPAAKAKAPTKTKAKG